MMVGPQRELVGAGDVYDSRIAWHQFGDAVAAVVEEDELTLGANPGARGTNAPPSQTLVDCARAS
jgi:hypothetical protein